MLFVREPFLPPKFPASFRFQMQAPGSNFYTPSEAEQCGGQGESSVAETIYRAPMTDPARDSSPGMESVMGFSDSRIGHLASRIADDFARSGKRAQTLSPSSVSRNGDRLSHMSLSLEILFCLPNTSCSAGFYCQRSCSCTELWCVHLISHSVHGRCSQPI